MRVLIEVSVDVHDSAALIATARRYYAQFVTAVDVSDMNEEEALAVADLTPDQQRAHPRYVTPKQAVPDAAAAAVRIIEDVFDGTGAEVESSSSKILTGARERDRKHTTRTNESGSGSRRNALLAARSLSRRTSR